MSVPTSESGPFWSLLSGGKDSVASTKYLSESGRLRGCIFLETGVAAPDTRPFVEAFCRRESWELRIFSTPKSYEQLVRRFGFPKGPRGHTWFYRALKERPLRAAARELGPNALFASGVRSKESARRMLTAQRWSQVRGGWIFAPILEWSDREVWAYLAANDLVPSPSSIALGLSGDCFCGAFSKRGECRAIAQLYPEFAARISALEQSVPKRYPLNRWGNRSAGFTGSRGLTRLEDFVCTQDCSSRSEEISAGDQAGADSPHPYAIGSLEGDFLARMRMPAVGADFLGDYRLITSGQPRAKASARGHPEVQSGPLHRNALETRLAHAVGNEGG